MNHVQDARHNIAALEPKLSKLASDIEACAKTMRDGMDKAVAKLTGVSTVRTGRGWAKAPRPMLKTPLSPEEQEVLATFHICPQCNVGDEVVRPHSLGGQHLGRWFACYVCDLTIQEILDTESRREITDAMQKMQKVRTKDMSMRPKPPKLMDSTQMDKWLK